MAAMQCVGGIYAGLAALAIGLTVAGCEGGGGPARAPVSSRRADGIAPDSVGGINSVGPSTAALAATIKLNRWTHVTATLDAITGQTQLYMDRVLVARMVTAARPFRDLDHGFQPGIGIGHSNYPPWFPYAFHGSIDELKVYNAVVQP